MWAIIGTLGIIAIEASYLPQIWRLHRLKHAESISVFYPALNVFGRILALMYAFNLGASVFSVGFLFGIGVRTVFLAQVAHYRGENARPSALLPVPLPTPSTTKSANTMERRALALLDAPTLSAGSILAPTVGDDGAPVLTFAAVKSHGPRS